MNGEPLVRWDWLWAHLGPIADRVGQHLYLAAIAIGVGFAISFVLAAVSIRRRRLYPPIVVVASAVVVTAIRSPVVALVAVALDLLMAAAIVTIVTIAMPAVSLAKGDPAAGQSHRQDDGYHCSAVHTMLH